MRLLLQRTHTAGPRTFGKLFADGVFLCYTLEDEVRESAGVPVAVWKIKGNTAIPSTSYAERPYRVTLEQSPRFGPDTITMHDVPGFQFIRMHAGNDEGDTEGCPLLGTAISDAGIRGGTSRPAVLLAREAVRQGIREGGVWLDVANIVEVA